MNISALKKKTQEQQKKKFTYNKSAKNNCLKHLQLRVGILNVTKYLISIYSHKGFLSADNSEYNLNSSHYYKTTYNILIYLSFHESAYYVTDDDTFLILIIAIDFHCCLLS